MRLTFLGTRGELGFVRRNCSCPQCTEARDLGINYPHRNPSSILVEIKSLNSGMGDPVYSRMLIDAGWGIRGGVATVWPQCVLLTSSHPNHAAGIIGVDPAIPVVFTHRTFLAVRPYLRTGRRFYLIEPGKSFHFNQLEVVAHKVYRSWLHPTVCYKIGGKVIYAPDCLGFMDEGILDGVELLICDGSSFQGDIVRSSRVGHMSVENSVALAIKHGLKKVIVTHIGHIGLDYLEMGSVINFLGAELAFDGVGLTSSWNIV